MLFHTFKNQDERRALGGSAFVEMQFCTLPAGTDIKTLVSADGISRWQNTSLYIADENAFNENYSRIFTGGTYNNLKTGPIDIYGINYYTPELMEEIIAKIRKEKPEDHESLIAWLTRTRDHNGLYILGI